MLRFVGFSQTRVGRNNPMARDWRVESLRLTLFSSENITVSDADWSGITGQQDADTRQKLPGGLRYIGRFAAGQLTVAALGQRLDVVLSWVPSERQAESPSIELPDIGAWEGVRDIFVAATQKWLESLKFPVIRIAFAPILLAETANVVESYGVLKDMLRSVKVDIHGMRELIFRVNWPEKSSTGENLIVNRITNWSAIQLSSALVQMTGAQISTTATTPEKFAARLEIDLNTDQENKVPFGKNSLVAIYNELVAKSSENVVSGERP